MRLEPELKPRHITRTGNGTQGILKMLTSAVLEHFIPIFFSGGPLRWGRREDPEEREKKRG